MSKCTRRACLGARRQGGLVVIILVNAVIVVAAFEFVVFPDLSLLVRSRCWRRRPWGWGRSRHSTNRSGGSSSSCSRGMRPSATTRAAGAVASACTAATSLCCAGPRGGRSLDRGRRFGSRRLFLVGSQQGITPSPGHGPRVLHVAQEFRG